jgi:Na+-driven multidrug efflux pump
MPHAAIRWLLALGATASLVVAIEKGAAAARHLKEASHSPVWFALGILGILWLIAVSGHVLAQRIRAGRNQRLTSVDLAYALVILIAFPAAGLFDWLAAAASGW